MDVLPLENGGIRFLEMPSAFYEQLLQLPESCDPAEDADILKRLYPEPVDAEEPEAEREAAAEDWAAFVRPELESAFDRALRLVLHDLTQAKASAGPIDDTENYYQLEIPQDHLEPWFQILNRARIVLTMKHSLSPRGADAPPDNALTLSRLLAAHLSEHYAEILEILVYQLRREFND
jgi:hypothetical protein